MDVARRVAVVGGGCSLVGALVAALALLAPSASATSQRLGVTPQVEQALVAALHAELSTKGNATPISNIQLVIPRPTASHEAPLVAFDATNQTYYASACARLRAPFAELFRLHSTFPYSPLTVSPQSITIACELFSKVTNGTWRVIPDTPSLGCGAVGTTLRALWNGVPACNAPVFDF